MMKDLVTISTQVLTDQHVLDQIFLGGGGQSVYLQYFFKSVLHISCTCLPFFHPHTRSENIQ